MNEFEQKVEEYRQKKARNISIAVFLYIFSVVSVIGCAVLLPVNGGIIGVLLMLLLIAIATGLIVYTSLNVPKDVASVLSEKSKEVSKYNGNKAGEADLVNSVKNLYWVIVTIIYLSVSFSTGAWHVSWLIWLIATAIEQALTIIFSIKYDSKNTRNSETNID